ncbi:hypothetical protein ACOTWK_05925 [Aliarcobacter butzleri]
MENFPLNKDEYIALEIAKLIFNNDNFKAQLPTTFKTKIFMDSYLEILEDVKKAQQKEPKVRSF